MLGGPAAARATAAAQGGCGGGGGAHSHEFGEFDALFVEFVLAGAAVACPQVDEAPRRALVAHHVLEHEAAVMGENGEDAVEVHAVLVLIKVVPHNRETGRAEEVRVHELLGGVVVAAEADAEQREVPARREEVAALEEGRRLDAADDVEACTLSPARLYDIFGEFLSVANAFSLVLCALLTVKGIYMPSSSDCGRNSSILYDLWWGMSSKSS